VTYSDDDYPPFAGDQTGQLLAEPDIVALSPVTSARVVETQSGYLVVLKKVDDRLSLSVKRRIGTPPSSQVMLTPDESVQLSRVLTDSVETLGDVRGDYLVRELTARTARSVPATPATDELSTIYGDKGNVEEKLDWDEIRQPWRKRKAKQSQQEPSNASSNQIEIEHRALPIKKILIAGGAVAAIAAVVGIVGWAGNTFGGPAQSGSSAQNDVKHKPATDPMAPDNVDRFVRNFVANMLDFNPRTYRSSQVQAMAVMKPRLLERYWQETSFPLSKSKLRAQHKDRTLIINKVLQQPKSSVTTDVEMAADLSTPGQGEPTSIRLEIDLGLNQDGQLIVTDIKDSSNKTDNSSDTTKAIESSSDATKATESGADENSDSENAADRNDNQSNNEQ
jgi:hypothetical protein